MKLPSLTVRRVPGLALVLGLAAGTAAFSHARAASLAQPFSPSASAQPLPRLTASGTYLPSNSVIDLEIYGPFLWAATGRGVGRFVPGNDPADPAAGAWVSYGPKDNIGQGGVSGLAIGTTSAGDTVVWVATAKDTSIRGESYAAGGGISFSADDGASWTWMPQPTDPRNATDIHPTTTDVQNVTYDIGILHDRVWIASWGGGLRYLDMDADSLYWVNQPPDTNSYDVIHNLNHRAFSIAVMDTLLWVGTADGVNLSRDNGLTWRSFRHSGSSEATLSGNFVPALGAQITSSGKHVIWAATWVAEASTEFYGVSKSEDNGFTWQRVLGSPTEPVRAHNFAFDDSVVYVATDDGLYKSSDFGESWAKFPPIFDKISGERTYDPSVYCAAAGLNRFFVGGSEGLGVSGNGGIDWRLVRTYPKTGTGGTPDTYAYPNPFSPNRIPVVRLQYHMDRPGNVTVEVYDFAMELVARPVDGESRPAGDHSEVWDGRGPGGREIANGVYFYRITGGGKERWGKVLVLD